MQKIIRNSLVNFVLSAVLLSGVALVIFSPEYLVIKWGANYAVRILFGYIGLAFLFLILGQKRLMTVSLFSAAALALFLKVMTGSEMKPPEKTKDEPVIKLAHFNVNNANENFTSAINTILSTDADMISVHEVTPQWDTVLLNNLSQTYPHYFSMPSMDLFGMMLFSKSPFTYLDTVYYKEIPSVVGGVALSEEHTLHFIDSHTLPALNYRYYDRLKEHLNQIAEYCNAMGKPLLAFGDYHTVPWSNEIAEFRTKTGLADSRRGFTPTFPHGTSTVFEVPIDHIFYSPDLKCLGFSAVSTLYTNHLGIQGTFQLKNTAEDVEKEN